MGTTLIICIGNVAREDDGAGHEVARLLQEESPDLDARVLVATDLDVAMAEDVAAVDLLVIVDAFRRSAPPVAIQELAPGPALRPTGHGIDASSLLQLSSTLWGRVPRAVAVTVAAPHMGHREGLGPTAVEASRQAADAVVKLLRESAKQKSDRTANPSRCSPPLELSSRRAPRLLLRSW